MVGDQTVEGWEGCLSIPEVRGRVPRAQHIKVSALDRNGKRFELDLKDFPRASSSTRPITSTACCSSIACARFESLTYLEEYSRYHAKRERARGRRRGIKTGVRAYGRRDAGGYLPTLNGTVAFVVSHAIASLPLVLVTSTK